MFEVPCYVGQRVIMVSFKRTDVKLKTRKEDSVCAGWFRARQSGPSSPVGAGGLPSAGDGRQEAPPCACPHFHFPSCHLCGGHVRELEGNWRALRLRWDKGALLGDRPLRMSESDPDEREAFVWGREGSPVPHARWSQGACPGIAFSLL